MAVSGFSAAAICTTQRARCNVQHETRRQAGRGTSPLLPPAATAAVCFGDCSAQRPSSRAWHWRRVRGWTVCRGERGVLQHLVLRCAMLHHVATRGLHAGLRGCGRTGCHREDACCRGSACSRPHRTTACPSRRAPARTRRTSKSRTSWHGPGTKRRGTQSREETRNREGLIKAPVRLLSPVSFGADVARGRPVPRGRGEPSL